MYMLRYSANYNCVSCQIVWLKRKASQSERFTDMFAQSIGLVKSNGEFVLCKKVGLSLSPTFVWVILCFSTIKIV